MPWARSLEAIHKRLFKNAKRSSLTQPSRALSITSRGKPISREALFTYTNGRFLANEAEACSRRYVRFDIDQLCAVAAAAGDSPHQSERSRRWRGALARPFLCAKRMAVKSSPRSPSPLLGDPSILPPRKWQFSNLVRLQHLFNNLFRPKTDCIPHGSKHAYSSPRSESPSLESRGTPLVPNT